MITQVKCIKCQNFAEDLWCNQYCQRCWESFSAGVWSAVMEQLKELSEKTTLN